MLKAPALLLLLSAQVIALDVAITYRNNLCDTINDALECPEPEVIACTPCATTTTMPTTTVAPAPCPTVAANSCLGCGHNSVCDSVDGCLCVDGFVRVDGNDCEAWSPLIQCAPDSYFVSRFETGFEVAIDTILHVDFDPTETPELTLSDFILLKFECTGSISNNSTVSFAVDYQAVDSADSDTDTINPALLVEGVAVNGQTPVTTDMLFQFAWNDLQAYEFTGAKTALSAGDNCFWNFYSASDETTPLIDCTTPVVYNPIRENTTIPESSGENVCTTNEDCDYSVEACLDSGSPDPVFSTCSCLTTQDADGFCTDLAEACTAEAACAGNYEITGTSIACVTAGVTEVYRRIAPTAEYTCGLHALQLDLDADVVVPLEYEVTHASGFVVDLETWNVTANDLYYFNGGLLATPAGWDITEEVVLEIDTDASSELVTVVKGSIRLSLQGVSDATRIDFAGIFLSLTPNAEHAFITLEVAGTTYGSLCDKCNPRVWWFNNPCITSTCEGETLCQVTSVLAATSSCV